MVVDIARGRPAAGSLEEKRPAKFAGFEDPSVRRALADSFGKEDARGEGHLRPKQAPLQESERMTLYYVDSDAPENRNCGVSPTAPFVDRPQTPEISLMAMSEVMRKENSCTFVDVRQQLSQQAEALGTLTPLAKRMHVEKATCGQSRHLCRSRRG
jgi:hypothetical protein